MPVPPPLDSPQDERSLERYLVVGLVLIVVLVGAFPIYRATEPERRARALEEMERQNVSLGRELFALHCAACHGDEGRGGRGMPTLAAKEFLGEVSNDQLHWLIAGGIPGTTMSAYTLDLGGPLTAQAIDRVVAYLRSLEGDAPSVPGWVAGAAAQVVATLAAGDAPAPSADPPLDREAVPTPAADSSSAPGPPGAIVPGTPAPPPADPPLDREAVQAPAPDPSSAPGAPGAIVPATPLVTDPLSSEQKSAAQVTYQALCAACHGPAGEGTPIGPAVRPPAPPLAADLDALVEAIGRGRPGTAMMGFDRAVGGPLESDEILELARWLMGAEG